MNKQTPEMILYWQLKLYRMTQGTQKNKREIVIVLIFFIRMDETFAFSPRGKNHRKKKLMNEMIIDS